MQMYEYFNLDNKTKILNIFWICYTAAFVMLLEKHFQYFVEDVRDKDLKIKCFRVISQKLL